MKRGTMMTMMSLASTTTNMNMNMNTSACMSTATATDMGMGTGAYGRPPVSSFSPDVDVDAHTRCMEAAAVAAARRASGAQVRNRIKDDKK